jgi:hypothetical protein
LPEWAMHPDVLYSMIDPILVDCARAAVLPDVAA